jgi:hypothetical protein
LDFTPSLGIFLADAGLFGPVGTAVLPAGGRFTGGTAGGGSEPAFWLNNNSLGAAKMSLLAEVLSASFTADGPAGLVAGSCWWVLFPASSWEDDHHFFALRLKFSVSSVLNHPGHNVCGVINIKCAGRNYFSMVETRNYRGA